MSLKHQLKQTIQKSEESSSLRVLIELPGNTPAMVISVCGSEGLNDLPSYELEIRLTPGVNAREFAKELLRKAIRFAIDTGDIEGPRWRSGIVVKVKQTRSSHSSNIQDNTLQLRVVSSLALLNFSRKYRSVVDRGMIDDCQALLAENKSAPAIVRLDPSTKTTAPPHRLQIGETNLNFLLRWWEDSGVNYHICADGADRVTLFSSAVQLAHRRHIVPWSTADRTDCRPSVEVMTTTHQIAVGSVRVSDLDSSRPTVSIDSTARAKAICTAGDAQYFGCGARSRDEATAFARQFQIALEFDACVSSGTGCLPLAAAGDCLSVDGEDPLLITRFRFDIALEPEPFVRSWFEAIPVETPLAPLNRAERPLPPNFSVATVIDREDPESRGRVRIRFPWEATDSPGIWCPVDHTHDHVFRPRVGQLVRVGFELGDPDRPVVGLSVYHTGDQPTDPLKESDLAGLRTPCHEVLFDDGPDTPHVQRHVGGDDVSFIDGDLHQRIEGDELTHVAGQRQVTVSGDVTLTAGGTLTLKATKVLIEGGGSFLELDDALFKAVGPIVHLNPPGASASVPKKCSKPAAKPSVYRTRRKTK